MESRISVFPYIRFAAFLSKWGLAKNVGKSMACSAGRIRDILRPIESGFVPNPLTS